MDWFKNLFNQLTGNVEEVHFISTGREFEPEIEDKPLFQFTPTVERSFEKFISQGDVFNDVLLFDPEEKSAYSYILTRDGAEVLETIPIDEWNSMVFTLKNMNRKKVDIAGKSYLLFLCISFTDLGERVSAIIFPADQFDDEVLQRQKKTAVARIRELKPPTALNRSHLENLYRMLDMCPQKDPEALFKILQDMAFIPDEVLSKLRESGDPRQALAHPAPRKLMIRALARWLGVDYFDVELTDIDEKVAKMLPEKVAKKIRAVPVAMRDEHYLVAFWNPLDMEAVNKVKEHLGDKIIPVMGCEEEIRSKVRGIHKK